MFAQTLKEVIAEVQSPAAAEPRTPNGMQSFFNTWKGVGAILSVLAILFGAALYILSLKYVDEDDFERTQLEQKSVDDELILKQLELKNKIVEVKAESEAKTQMVSQELGSKIEAVEKEEKHIKEDVGEIKDSVKEIQEDQKIQNENMTRLLTKFNVKPAEQPSK